jgi:ABC-type phosphate transport system auxiliary subunit
VLAMNPGAQLPPEEPEMPIVLEKGRLNVFNAIGMTIAVLAQVVVGAAVWVNLTRDVDDAQKAITEVRESQVQRASISDKSYEKISDLQYGQKQQAKELQELKDSIAATNVRVDKFIELINGKLDGISENINGLRIDVRVMGASNKKAELDDAKRPARQ